MFKGGINMLKRLISIVLSVSLLLSMSTITLGVSQPKPSVVLNGNTISLEGEAYINEEGQIMCPLRELAEYLDYSITWDGKEQSIILSNDSKIIKLRIGESNITINKEDMKMNSIPVIKEGKTFVPVELFSKVLNLIVGWDNEQQILKINQPKENTEAFFTTSEDKAIEDELNTYMKALQENQNFHGSVLVAKDGEVIINQGCGFADMKQNTVNKPGTKFAIGSATKQFTAMAIMQLSEKGMVNVEDKVSKYFPDFPNGDLITIHNLLTHTSGLKNYTDLHEFLGMNPDNKDPMVVISLIKDMPLEFKPGEEYRYSNTNYVLLGMVIENVTNMSFENYLKENIFDPLNMKDTGICYGENSEIHDATAYTGYLEVVPIDDKLVLTQAYSAGNMYSTVEDLYRWDQALSTEQLVKKETLDEIFTEHATIPEVGSYGYGWMIADTDIGKEIWHGGNTFGFTANIARYIDEDLTIIVLINNGLYNVMDLTNTLTSIALNKDYKMPEVLKEIKIDDTDVYDNYVGKYTFLSGTYMDIIKKDNNLYAQVTGQNAFRIFPQTNTKFFAKEIDASIEFTINDKGEVTELIFEQLGMQIVCQRVGDIEAKVVASIDPIIYDKYVGEYELAPDIIVTIIKEDNRIYAQLTGQDRYEIFPISESEYFYKVVDAKITFVKDDGGKVTNLVLHQQGQDMPASKIK